MTQEIYCIKCGEYKRMEVIKLPEWDRAKCADCGCLFKKENWEIYYDPEYDIGEEESK